MNLKATNTKVKIAFLIAMSFFDVRDLRGSEISITIDDFNLPNEALSAEEKDRRILAALAEAEVQAELFVTVGIANTEVARRRLQVWDKSRHILANHTYHHWNYHSTSFAKFSKDVMDADAVLSQFQRFERRFRFPQLKEGNTREKRDQIRRFLKEKGYENGYVTVDASDWYIDQRLGHRLAKNPTADIAPYRKYYLEHVWDRAKYYDELAIKVLGRTVKHTLLIHHNLLNAYFLGDLIQMLRSRGWKVINAKEAFQDPIFKTETSIVPAGESIIWALAKQSGKFSKELRYPGEDGVYEKERMDRLGL